MGRIHSDKSLGSWRVLWARAKANHLPDPQEQQGNLILKNGSGSHTRQTVNPLLLSGESAIPLLRLWEPLLHSFTYKQSHILGWRRHSAAKQDCAYFQGCHLLCTQAARASNSSSNNKAVSLEHSAVQDRPSFPNTNRFPSPGPESESATNIWVSHTSNYSLLQLSCSNEN